jgi:glucose/arabinose dehydrogenase
MVHAGRKRFDDGSVMPVASPTGTIVPVTVTKALCLLGLLLMVSCMAPQSAAAPSPSTTIAPATATLTSTPAPATQAPSTAAPTVNPNSCIAGSDNPACPFELFVDRLAVALEASDYAGLRPLVTPTGFVGAQNGSEGGPPQTRDQLVERLQKGTPDGKLRVTVTRRPLIPTTTFLPPGSWYVVSTFSQFDNQAQQKVYLIMRSESGSVYWSGALFNAP